PAFFLGDYSHEGWWSYFPVAFLIKTPVGTLLLIASALFFCRFGSSASVRREMIFLLVPPVFFFFVMTKATINIGLRHILPVYPFLFVLASRLATVQLRRRWLTLAILSPPLALTVISALRIAP